MTPIFEVCKEESVDINLVSNHLEKDVSTVSTIFHIPLRTTESNETYKDCELINQMPYDNEPIETKKIASQSSKIVFHQTDDVKPHIPYSYTSVGVQKYLFKDTYKLQNDIIKESLSPPKYVKYIPFTEDVPVLLNLPRRGSVEIEQHVSELHSIPEEHADVSDEVGSAHYNYLGQIDFDNFSADTTNNQKLKFFIAEIDYLNERNIFNNYAINNLFYNRSDFTNDSDKSNYTIKSQEDVMEDLNQSLKNKLNKLVELKTELKCPYHIPKYEISIIDQITCPGSNYSFKELFNSWLKGLSKLQRHAQDQINHELEERVKKMTQVIDEVTQDNNKLNEQVIKMKDEVKQLRNDNGILQKKVDNFNPKKGSDENKLSQTKLTSRIPFLKDKPNDHPSVLTEKHYIEVEKRVLADLCNAKRSLATSVDNLNQFKNRDYNTKELINAFSNIQKINEKLNQAIQSIKDKASVRHPSESEVIKTQNDKEKINYASDSTTRDKTYQKLSLSNEQPATVHYKHERSNQITEKTSRSIGKSQNIPLVSEQVNQKYDNAVSISTQTPNTPSPKSEKIHQLPESTKKSYKTTQKLDSVKKSSNIVQRVDGVKKSEKSKELSDDNNYSKSDIISNKINSRVSKNEQITQQDDTEFMMKSIGRDVSLAEVQAIISAELSLINMKKFGNLLAEDNFNLATEIDKLLITIEALRSQLKENCEILSETVDMLQNSEAIVEDLENKLSEKTKNNQDLSSQIVQLNQCSEKIIEELNRLINSNFKIYEKDNLENSANKPSTSKSVSSENPCDKILNSIKVLENHIQKHIKEIKTTSIDQLLSDNVRFEFETSLLPEGHLFGSITIFESSTSNAPSVKLTFNADLFNFNPLTANATTLPTHAEALKEAQLIFNQKLPENTKLKRSNQDDDDDNNNLNYNNNNNNNNNVSYDNKMKLFVNKSSLSNNVNKQTISKLFSKVPTGNNNNNSMDSYSTSQYQIRSLKRWKSVSELTTNTNTNNCNSVNLVSPNRQYTFINYRKPIYFRNIYTNE